MKNDLIDSSDFAWFFCVAVMSLLGFFSGCNAGQQRVQREAVQQNQAHYTVDNEGKTTFVWGSKK